MYMRYKGMICTKLFQLYLQNIAKSNIIKGVIGMSQNEDISEYEKPFGSRHFSVSVSGSLRGNSSSSVF